MATPEEILEGLGLSGEFSIEAVATVNAEIEKLVPKAIAAKEKHLEQKAKRKVIREQWDDLVAARHALYGQRDARPDDVVVSG
jgi:hypothetical protein